MNTRSLQSKRPGQSIPLIALIIVVLFGMVGLAVDVGSTYAAQRNAVRASNAASLAGMKMLINNGTDRGIWVAIEESLRNNGIEAAELGDALTSKYRVTAQYFDANGNVMGNGCRVGECTFDALPPTGAIYIRVEVNGLNETHFARVVGRTDLPVNAQSYAGPCSPLSYVFPIAINGDADHMDARGFIPPDDPSVRYGLYSIGDYEDVSLRRLYLKNDSGTTGDFSFLTWRPGADLQNMLTGDGSLDLGFTEAPWPEGVEGKFEYPRYPTVLNAKDQDWIQIQTLSGSDEDRVESALQAHKDQRTVMYLPVFTKQVWSGSNGVVQISGMGAFMIDTVDLTAERPFIDLAYVRDAPEVPCPLTSANVPGSEDNPNPKSYNVVGRVFIQPVHNIREEGGRQPVSFTVLLDTSGSMNWNFAGQGGDSSKTYQCGATSDPGVTRISCGARQNFWSPLTERRIAVAKMAIKQFIDRMDANDQMRIIGYGSPANTKIMDEWQYGDAAGKLALKQAVDGTACSKYNPNPPNEADKELCSSDADRYKGSGETPSASALWHARNMLENDSRAQDGITAPNGREYKRVVVFMTDGIANQLLNTSDGSSEDNNSHWPDDCPTDDPRKGENVLCQLGIRPDGRERPITAMVTQGSLVKQGNDQDDPTDDVAVYVLAMAGVAKNGLNEVASQSSSPYYMEANHPEQVATMLNAIFTSAKEGGCQPGGGTTWINKIPSGNLADPAAFPEADWQLLDSDTFGFVYLSTVSGEFINKFEIVEDTTTPSGGMVFNMLDLGSGTYQIEAFVGYKGVDNISRSYATIYDPYSYTGKMSMEIQVTPSNTLNQTIALDPIYLKLDGSVCPAAPQP